MKLFDFAVGNPAYNSDPSLSGENGSYAKPVYNNFLDEAYKIAKKVEMIHPARFLFNAGGTPKEWNEKMLNDPHFKILAHEQDSSSVFSNTDIMGGVVISYHDNEKDFGAIGTYTAFPELNRIMRKAKSRSDFTPFNTIIANRGLYRFSKQAYTEQPNEMAKVSDPRIMGGSFDRMPLLFSEKKPEGNEYVRFYGLSQSKRCYRWLLREYVKPIENIEKYKVFVPKANGSGAIGEVVPTQLIGNPVVGNPLEGCTETFISIGNFKTRAEADACMEYIKSKFARVLLGVLKITQDNTAEKWKCVPLQDFTSNSDINWNTSIHNIDLQLYKKYGLTQEEIDFIETHVKEME